MRSSSALVVLASMFAMKVSLLRASRKLVSSTFTFVMVPLHVALLSILLFVSEVLVIFGSKMVEKPARDHWTGSMDLAIVGLRAHCQGSVFIISSSFIVVFQLRMVMD